MATLNQRLWDHGSVRFGAAVLLFVLLLLCWCLRLLWHECDGFFGRSSRLLLLLHF